MARHCMNVGSILHLKVDYSVWSTNKLLSNICIRPRASASVRLKSRSWNIHGIRLIADAEDVKTMPPSEIHVKKFKSKEVGIQKETMNLYSRAGRAKSCKKSSRFKQLYTKREATSRKNLNKILQKIKEEARDPSPDVEARHYEVRWDITYIGIMLLQG